MLFPVCPGVYLFKDKDGKILYVGKAVRLRHRLASYFRPEESLTPKTRVMVKSASSIDILQTGTEKEALLLEASLIKKHRPRYNILLRDDKEYLLFRIQTDQDFPRLEIIRKSSLKGQNISKARNKFYGPFSSAQAAKETWRLIHRSFPLRRCRDRAFANRSRPCLYYHMGQCMGPCVLDVDKKNYAAMIRQVDLLLTGRSDELVVDLEKDMYKASDEMEYERAAQLRDQLQAVKKTVERQSVVLPFSVDLDLIGVTQLRDGLALGILFVRDGLLLDGRNFFWPGLSLEETPELLVSFLTQYYIAGRGTPPRRIVVPWLPEKGWTERLKPLVESGIIDLADTEAQEGGKTLLEGDKINQKSILPTVSYEQDMQKNKGEVFPLPSKNRLNNGGGVGLREGLLQFTKISGERVLSLKEKTLEEKEITPKGEMPAKEESSAEGKVPYLLDYDSEEVGIVALEQALSDISGQPVSISSPQNPDEDNLLIMAADNAREYARTEGGQPLEYMLAKALRVDNPIFRVEAVDISHTAGRNTRAGMVVFEGESPVKSDYRQYALDDDLKKHGYAEGDDYAALSIWAKRRASAGGPWPDLVLVDGGKGQLSAVERSFKEAGVLENFYLAAITKARDEEGFADRRAGNISDRIFLPGRSNPLPLKAGSPELLYLQRVRDTVHDFALGRHRQARSKAALAGELTRLPGVGPKTARLLYDHFGSLSAMAEASKEELMKVPSIGEARATILHERLASLVQLKED